MSSPRGGWRGLERLVFQAVRGVREKQSSAVLLTEKDLQQLAKSQNGPLLTDIIDTFRTWCSKPPPKGFEKFFKTNREPKKQQERQRQQGNRELPNLRQLQGQGWTLPRGKWRPRQRMTCPSC